MSYKSELIEHYKQVKARLNGRPCGLAPTVPRHAIAGLSGPTGVSPPAAPISLPSTSKAPRLPLAKNSFEYPPMEPLPGLNLEDTGERRWRRVLVAVCAKHYVDPDLVMSPVRTKAAVAARHETIYRIRTELNYSYKQIAEDFSLDHSSVMHAVKKIFDKHIDGAFLKAHRG